MTLNGRVLDGKGKNFVPPATCSQSTTKNETWVNVTITQTEADGTVSQASTFINKRG